MDWMPLLYSAVEPDRYFREDRCMEPLLIAFDSTQQALRAEMLLEYAEIEIDIRPTPKEVTAGCALSIEFPEGDLQEVRHLIAIERVEIRGLFRKTDTGYDPIEL
jgi:hypothetical protein